MPSKMPKIYLRLSGEVESNLRKLYRARLLDLERKEKRAISFNAFLVYCLESYERSEDGVFLSMVYNQELFESDRHEKQTVLERKKAASKANGKEWEVDED